MSLAFANPIHVNGGLIFAPQDYVSAPSAFAGAGVMSLLRWRGRFAGVGIDNNGFMANDVDPNGDPLSYRIVSGVSNGTLATYLGGAFTYTPNLNFVGVDSFVYQLYAGGTAGGTATVTLTVTGAFAGAAVTARVRLHSVPAALSFGVGLQSVPSRWRLRSVAGVISLGAVLQAVPARLKLMVAPATITIGGSANQVVNGDFSGASILPWIAGPNTLATIVNGQVRLSAIVASSTPIYIYQSVPTVPGILYALDVDVIPGLGFGSAGVTVNDPLVGSGGSLTYGGHVSATYLATSAQAFVVLNYAIVDVTEFVLFDNVALAGLSVATPVNVQGVYSALRLRSLPAALAMVSGSNTGLTIIDQDASSELAAGYVGGAALVVGLVGTPVRIDCGADLSDTTNTSVSILRPDGTVVTRVGTIGARKVRSRLGKTLRPNHYVSFVPQAGDFIMAGRHFVRVTASDGAGKQLTLRRFLVDVES